MEGRGEASTAGARRAGEPHSPSGDPFARMAAGDVVFCAVWRSNYAAEIEAILDRVRRRPRRMYVSIDLEFCGSANVNPRYWPHDPEDWYQNLRNFVHGGDVLQIGLALAFEQPPGAPTEPVIAWDVNLRFDEASRAYHPDTVAFLAGHGHDLARHKDEGVLPDLACAALLRNLPLGDPSVTWIVYHGDKDVAFVLKLLQRSGLLPLERQDFLQLVREKLPSLYDVKVMAQVVQPGYNGGLQNLASIINVDRIGNPHQASSDAVLTMACFANLCNTSKSVPQKILCRHALLSGLEQLHPAIIKARSIHDTYSQILVEVNVSNFDHEARRISELVASNFNIIITDFSLPGLKPPSLMSSNARQEYELMKGALEQRDQDAAEVVLGFTNVEGFLGLGCLWKFRFDMTAARDVSTAAASDGSGCVPASRFWALMAACGAVHDPGTTWLSCHGGYGFAWMIKSFLPPVSLPEKRNDYVQIRAALWPSLYDVGLIAHWCAGVQFRAPGCKGKLIDLARSLEVPVQENLTKSGSDSVNRALLLLKCFRELSMLPEFNIVSKSVRGGAMSSCCWACSASPGVPGV